MSLNIWDLAKEKLKENQEKAAQLDEKLEDEGHVGHVGAVNEIKRRHESVVLVCGNKACGKTSLIMRFLERNENPKTSIGLEYTYGRRTRGSNKDVGHLWELGGGAVLTNLLDIPINAKNIEITSVIIMLDLTKPHELWSTAESLLNGLKKTVTSVLKDVNRQNPTVYDRIMANCKTRCSNNKEINLCDPFPLPLAFVGGKYDEFQNMESEQRRQICKAMRFLAHYYGANLLFFSSRMENLVVRGRALLSHFAFCTGNSKGISTDHNKPMFVSVGADSFEEIGAPPVADASFAAMKATQPVALWADAFSNIFPQKEIKQTLPEDPTSDPIFEEPTIDKLIEQKMNDLELYRKQRKDRQAAEQRAMERLQQ